MNGNNNLYLQLLQCSIKTKHSLARLAEQYDLSIMQLYTLCLMNEDEAIPMNSISCQLDCDASNVTGIADRLLALGYIKRDENPDDRRVKMITLTEKGKAIRTGILSVLNEYTFSGLQTLTDSQRNELSLLLSIILEPSADAKRSTPIKNI